MWCVEKTDYTAKLKVFRVKVLSVAKSARNRKNISFSKLKNIELGELRNIGVHSTHGSGTQDSLSLRGTARPPQIDNVPGLMKKINSRCFGPAIAKYLEMCLVSLSPVTIDCGCLILFHKATQRV